MVASLFYLGKVVATPGALALLADARTNLAELLVESSKIRGLMENRMLV